MLRIATVLLGGTLIAAAASPTYGQTFDHLQCFKIKDSLARGRVTADLVPEHQPPFGDALGCKIKLPATLFCTDVAKENVQPPAPLAVGGDTARDYFCYRVSCSKRAEVTTQAEDQFGARVIRIRSAPLFCVPAVRPTPKPTATPTPTPVFCNDSEAPACNGVCEVVPGSVCVNLAPGFCGCVDPTPTPSATRTRTPTPQPTP